ncbi:MAG: hypothetical protein LWX56_04480 [Ignavibacteria bacterium]|nr:hypothetical protein [Ignavibacteria bacterium]
MKTTISPAKQPVIILLATLVLLLVLSIIPDGMQVFSYKVKKLDLFMDIRKDEVVQPTQSNNTSNALSVQYASVINFEFINHILSETAIISDRLAPEPALAPAAAKIENPAALKKFLDALKQSGSKKVRIAHYGDSAIEGDNISADLRKNLQQKFGGNGVGFVPVVSQDKQFRTTTDMDWSQDWKSSSLISTNPERLPLGVNGAIYQPVANSWVKLAASGRNTNVKNFGLARILYVSEKNCTIKYSFDDKPEVTTELKACKGVNECVLSANGKARSIKITILNPSKTFFYGISLEEGNGVYVDNFPLRGNSGASLRDIDLNLLKGFDKLMDYRLIILNFGLNMTGPDAKDYGWYEAAMLKVIDQYKQAFPQASFLVVSVQDRSTKKGSQFVTDPSVPKLVEMQKKIATKANVAFWNLYDAMGGMNSMSSWVDQGFADKDYTHLKLTGSKKIADLLTEALLSAQ